MKKALLILALIIVFASLFAYKSFASKNATHSEYIAHPGRTDRYGCHRCRTNCEYWGLEYGEYHCH